MVHKMKLFQKIFPYWAYKILDLEKRLPDSAKLQDLVGKSLDTISDVAKKHTIVHCWGWEAGDKNVRNLGLLCHRTTDGFPLCWGGEKCV